MSNPISKEEQILKVEGLKMHFPARGPLSSDRIRKKAGWSGSSIRHGETLGLVGESGCGKSTLGKRIVRLSNRPPEKFFSKERILPICRNSCDPTGRISNGISGSGESMRRMSVGELISEHGHSEDRDRGERIRRVEELLELVGLPKNGKSFLSSFRAVSVSVLALRGPLRLTLSFWFWTSPSRHWTYLFKVRF